ncbi:MAG: hypothetical protein AABW81_02430 [Nanoarchaeota archaeon]
MNAKQKRKFNQIAKDISSIKIQGARNIAKSALIAYNLIPTITSKKLLLSLRPTEPMMRKVLDMAERKNNSKEIINHFTESQYKINKYVLKLINKDDVVFTHCHSTNVINALIYSKKKGKKFQVYNTETRPLFQGRKTSQELRKAGIKVTQFIDSAMKQAIDNSDIIFLGADAILKKGVINKIGSGLIAETARDNIGKKVSLYIIADSWKYTKDKVPIESRKLNEVWDKAPKNIKIKNLTFEFIPKKYIKAVVSELGILSYTNFLKRVE